MTNKRTFKKLVSFLLAVIMMFSVMTTAFAAETDVAQTSHDNIYFKGGFDNWVQHDMDWVATNHYRCTVTVNKGTHTAQILNNGINRGCGTAINDVTSSDGWDLYTSPHTFQWVVTTGGTYTIDYKINGDKHTIYISNPNAGGSGDITYGEFPIDFIEGERKVYLVNQAGWGTPTFYAWKDTSTSNAVWPGVKMTDTGKTMSINNTTYKIYEATVPEGMNNCIFSNNGSSQTADLTYKQYNYYNNSTSVWTYKEPIAGGEIEPTDPTEPSDTIRVYFRDDYTGGEIESDDAKFFVKGNDNEVVEMTETIDVLSGHILWYADLASTNTSFTFYRTSYFFDKSNAASGAWNTWNAGTKGAAYFYSAQGWGSGTWLSDSIKEPDTSDINNFWFGLWVDTKGTLDTANAVRAYYKTTTEAHLYLPSYVDLSSVNLYSSYHSATLTVNGAAVDLNKNALTKVNLQTGTYTLKAKRTASSTEQTITLKVYTTNSTATMLFTTDEELFTGLTSGLQSSDAWPSGSGITAENYNGVYKDAIETKGSIYLYDENGALVNDGDGETKLKKIKGRGNSSFEASMRVYGKYAYNFNLDKKVALIDGATASKKWCLLANNPDITMMRNTFIYSLADDVGLKYGPETRLVDVYDNGKYLGAYIITEKVEYGKNTLMSDMKNLDDGNEDANIEAYANEDIMDDLEGHLVQATSSVTVNGQTYTYQYTKSDDETNWPYHQPENYTSYNYLLEWELYNRYTNEASWFVSPRTGQAVVVKYPEFATKDEMEWIISEFEAAEAAIYANDTDAIKAEVDVDSFARMYLIQELALNLDSCATSYYVHNDLASGKLVASPVWDYDWSLGAYSNTTDSGKKFKFNGSSVVVNSTTMDNPKQMFVKNKALKTDSGDNTKKANYNFQAKLVHNDYVWERCQYYWTNLFVPNLDRYLDDKYDVDANAFSSSSDDSGRIVGEWLPRFRTSMEMNDARWGSVTFTGDNWGTKITTNYSKGSFNFNVGQGTAGSATKSYDNSVYYLNDWVVTRWQYMSNEGGLFDESIKESIQAKNATFVGELVDDQLTITPAVEIIYNGNRVDGDYPNLITYEVYVNDTKTTTSTLDTPVTITLKSGVESNVYIVAYLTNAPNTKATSPVQKFSYGISEYTIENVTFTAEQNAGNVTVTPSATVKLDGNNVAVNLIEYTVYVNGVATVTKTFAEGSAIVTIPEGQYSEVYVKVNPVGVPTKAGTSEKQTFGFNVQVEKVEATLYFKSSSSARYAPKLTFGDTVVSMTKSGSAIGKNASQTQSYYWYTVTVEIEKDTATKLTFTNTYSMNASATVTLSEDTVKYYGVDNLNDGSAVVDLSDAEDYIKNFVKSASHMVYNDAHDAGVATTSIDGKIYKMGDADGDNIVSVMDSTQIQRALAGKTELSETNASLADFDLNSVNSIMDATGVQTFLTV